MHINLDLWNLRCSNNCTGNPRLVTLTSALHHFQTYLAIISFPSKAYQIQFNAIFNSH